MSVVNRITEFFKGDYQIGFIIPGMACNDPFAYAVDNIA